MKFISELELLKTIINEYEKEYIRRIKNSKEKKENDKSVIWIPIDVNKIAEKLKLPNGELVFQQLRHLNNKMQVKPNIPLFSESAGKEKNCVNFSFIYFTILGLLDKENKIKKANFWSVVAVIISIIALFPIADIIRNLF